MNSIREEKIKRDIKNTMEETANTIAFATAETVSVIAFIVAVGFLDGTWKDWIILTATASGIALRYLEKKTSWFQKCAKYFYLSLSFWCTCVLIFANDGKYAAVSQVYFMFLTVLIAYCDIKMVIYCAADNGSQYRRRSYLFPGSNAKGGRVQHMDLYFNRICHSRRSGSDYCKSYEAAD